MCVLHYDTMLLEESHSLPDGVGTNRVFAEGLQIPYMLPYLVCFKCARVATFCNMLPHFVNILP